MRREFRKVRGGDVKEMRVKKSSGKFGPIQEREKSKGTKKPGRVYYSIAQGTGRPRGKSWVDGKPGGGGKTKSPEVVGRHWGEEGGGRSFQDNTGQKWEGGEDKHVRGQTERREDDQNKHLIKKKFSRKKKKKKKNQTFSNQRGLATLEPRKK